MRVTGILLTICLNIINFLELALISLEKNVMKKYNSGIKSCSTHPHNYYFQLLGETGLIGFLLFFYLLFINYKNVN